MLAAKNGVIKVAILHKSTLHIRTFLAPNLEAHKPPAKKKVSYKFTAEENSDSYLVFDC